MHQRGDDPCPLGFLVRVGGRSCHFGNTFQRRRRLKELRQAVVRFFQDWLALTYPLESTLIAGGSRPLIFAAYASVVDPGDKVIYPTPSWNNNHYTYLMRAEAVEIVVGPETNFLPTASTRSP